MRYREVERMVKADGDGGLGEYRGFRDCPFIAIFLIF
jgi:hypothetical protein